MDHHGPHGSHRSQIGTGVITVRTGTDTDDNHQRPAGQTRHAGKPQARQMISSYAQPHPA
jgi:hypothetical protein